MARSMAEAAIYVKITTNQNFGAGRVLPGRPKVDDARSEGRKETDRSHRERSTVLGGEVGFGVVVQLSLRYDAARGDYA